MFYRQHYYKSILLVHKIAHFSATASNNIIIIIIYSTVLDSLGETDILVNIHEQFRSLEFSAKIYFHPPRLCVTYISALHYVSLREQN